MHGEKGMNATVPASLIRYPYGPETCAKCHEEMYNHNATSKHFKRSALYNWGATQGWCYSKSCRPMAYCIAARGKEGDCCSPKCVEETAAHKNSKNCSTEMMQDRCVRIQFSPQGARIPPA